VSSVGVLESNIRFYSFLCSAIDAATERLLLSLRRKEVLETGLAHFVGFTAQYLLFAFHFSVADWYAGKFLLR